MDTYYDGGRIEKEGTTVDVMKKLKLIGADVMLVDNDGWNVLHWACFHGSLDGVKTIIEEFDGIKLGLHLVKDKEGLTPLEHAIRENNQEIVACIQTNFEA